MRFIVDECTGPAVAVWLSGEGRDVCSVYDEIRGADDITILRKAHSEERIVVTNDRDFGEMVFKEQLPHHGVILLRLENERSFVKIETLRRLIDSYGEQLPDRFAVVTESRVRFANR